MEMKIEPTSIAGVMTVEIEPLADDRGIFARTFCAETFAKHGLLSEFPQSNTSWNAHRGTLRGMHYQDEPHSEVKLVRCTRGRIYDVIVDLRSDSNTYKKWLAVELDAQLRNAIYIPAGCAHGFMTLQDNCEVFYQMGESYFPHLARGVRWDDPEFAVEWPALPAHISQRDANYPNYSQ
jgi:dTDP-4-dehydrorhamnose 3,5-epimerase